MVNWIRVAAVLFVVGLALTLTTGYDNRRVVVAHETMSFEDDYLQMGPYDPGHYDWEIWIEEYYPGFDETTPFDCSASDDLDNTTFDSYLPASYQVREIDGVECELMHMWAPSHFNENETFFYVESRLDPLGGPEDTVEVFLIRSGSIILQLIFIVGLIITMIGLIMLVLLRMPGRKAAAG